MDKTEWAAWLLSYGTAIARVAFLLVAGIPIVHLCGKGIRRILRKRLSPQGTMLAGKAVMYGGMTLILVMVLRELGFKLTALLGAAGVAGVAIGFASQTSLSNLISGLFVIWERPFQVGDVLSISGTVGVVHSIDLLSVKLRTFDNKFVRIPNESLVKNEVTNITYFPIRRMDINVNVAYKEDIAAVMRCMQEVADKNPFSLDEPAPLIIFKGFGDSALEFLLGVWFEKTDFIQLRNSIQRDLKERFDQEGIEIAFPHRTLYAGTASKPFPVRIVAEDDAQAPPTHAETPAGDAAK